MFYNKKYYCPVCDRKHHKYKPLPDFYEKNSKAFGFKYFDTCEMTAIDSYSCCKCRASDRERLYALFIRNNFKGNEQLTFYHFAPEDSLRKFINNYFCNNISYKTFDLLANNVDINADLTNLNMIDNDVCDFFICSHILEHIEEDMKAITELYRITKPGGKGIIMAPISLAINESVENIPEVQTDEDRWKYYGQNDHIRLYAKNDFVNRISDSGFKLHQYDIKYFGEEIFSRLGLKNTSTLYVAEKEA